VVEQGPVKTVLKRPEHPYTQGLLRTIPNDAAPDQPLFSIRGTVPSLLQPPTGCAFAPRCDRAMAECARAAPPPYRLESDHQVACFLHRGRDSTQPQISQITQIDRGSSGP
jgi:oligopeptide/dipeptide ABC transporter ATP-binding protein